MDGEWYKQEVAQGQHCHWRIGPLDLWASGADGEWRVAVSRTEDSNTPVVIDNAGPEEGLEQRRWVSAIKGEALQVVPVMPDRSVIVRPQAPVQVVAGREALFFVSVPVWVRVIAKAPGSDEIVLCEEYTVQLSNSWFGLPTEGELCYALRSRARRNLQELDPVPYRAICPILIRNEAEKALDFLRLCLRSRDLGLYAGRTHMWTNAATVTHRSEGAAQVTYSDGAPEHDNAEALVSKARDKSERGLMSRTFDNLKSFSSF